ncbi:MAG: DEAD/DEAH box helicase, partial [Clostridia bacterium]|nr:DEAD/DEAH box helicase [Clostridia bacterium]
MNKEILQGIKNTLTYGKLITRFSELNAINSNVPLLVNGVSEGALYSLLYSLSDDVKRIKKSPILILVGEERKANKINEFLRKAGIKSEFYPVRDLNFYDMTSSHEMEYERLKVLSGLLFKSVDVVVATPDSVLQYTVPKKRLKENTLEINIDTSLDVSQIVQCLIQMGYSSTEMVEGAGQFSSRGGIIDVFPTNCEFKANGIRRRESLPIRIELFGDEIERMATFDIVSQRMIDKIDNFVITPSKEIIPTKENLESLRNELCKLLAVATKEDSIRELQNEIAAIDGGLSLSFLDKFINLIYPEKECLLDYFDDKSTVFVCETNSVSQKAKTSESMDHEIIKGLVENHLIVGKYAEFSAPVSIINKFYGERQCINIDTFLVTRGEAGGLYNFGIKGISLANSSITSILEELDYFVKNKYKVALVCQNVQEAKSIVKTLNDVNIPSFMAENATCTGIGAGTVAVFCDSYPEGYDIPSAKFALLVLSSKRNDGEKKNVKTKKFGKNAGEKIMSHTDLEVGDYVVHINYGIGRFLGIENKYIMGVHRDYIIIQYAGTEKLYIPVEQLDMVAKYIGTKSADGEVKLSKIGGTAWTKAKNKAKTSAKEMAKELIELYARRTRIDGFSFEPDGVIEREFDALFEYEETDSQLAAIADIKADMEKPYPMDRVLCGDVGYGKTEVALRAAMKAIANNKQVAILVPTTMLAMQHYQTALSRFAGTGVNIGMISRFRTAKDQAQTLRRLRRGDLDIIIGTHKLLANKVQFKDLGLLIVDEEQRFGVAQKEKIKQAVPDVDVLSLSATPIPRTLSMAMSGIRDMSVLDEAPTGRVGVQSYVLEYDENIINEAIRRELHRGGQVFYL